MKAMADLIKNLRLKRRKLRFTQLVRLCESYFGPPRIKGSHYILKTPWKGDPRINLQKVKGKAKPYQVDQVIDALERLQESESDGSRGDQEEKDPEDCRDRKN